MIVLTHNFFQFNYLLRYHFDRCVNVYGKGSGLCQGNEGVQISYGWEVKIQI